MAAVKAKKEYGPKWLYGKADRCDREKRTGFSKTDEYYKFRCVRDAVVSRIEGNFCGECDRGKR